MRALTVVPGRAGSGELRLMPAPVFDGRSVLVRTLGVGVCGTDREILAGHYGASESGRDVLILGHESLGEVIDAPPGSGVSPGELVVGIVRHPDPEPCRACAIGEWDMCLNGRYTEHGIKALDGFCVEQFQIAPEFVLRVDPLLRETGVLIEPASVVAKAWDHIERIGQRSRSWVPRRVLVTGAGTIGLLAALLASQRDCELHVYDRDRGPLKRDLVATLGGEYHCDSLDELGTLGADVVIECTGAPTVIAHVIGHNANGAVVCLAGLSSGVHQIDYDFAAFNRNIVLQNDVVFGSVNANRRHYELAARALTEADQGWLGRLITRRVALADWRTALERRADDIKVVIDFTLQ